MAVYFLLRSANERRGQRFVQLKLPSVLAWFQKAWRRGYDWEADLRGPVYGLDALFDLPSNGVAAPATDAALVALLEQHLHVERDLTAEPHFVHVETDDDEDDVAYYFFDDDFLDTDDALDRLPAPLEGGDDEDEEGDDEDDDAYRALIERRRR
jgi:hypothetical protein